MNVIDIEFNKNDFIRISDFIYSITNSNFYVFEIIGNNRYYLSQYINYQNQVKKYVGDVTKVFKNRKMNDEYTIFISIKGIDILKNNKYVGTVSNLIEVIPSLTKIRKLLQITDIIDNTKQITKEKPKILPMALPEELIIHQLSYFTPKEIIGIKDQYTILNKYRNDVWCTLLKEHFGIYKKDLKNCYEEYEKQLKINVKIMSDLSDSEGICSTMSTFNFETAFSSNDAKKYIFLVYRNKIWLFTDLDYFIQFLQKNDINKKTNELYKTCHDMDK
jgi:hypothetical protein